MFPAVPGCRPPGWSRASFREPVGRPSKSDFFTPRQGREWREQGGKQDEVSHRSCLEKSGTGRAAGSLAPGRSGPGLGSALCTQTSPRVLPRTVLQPPGTVQVPGPRTRPSKEAGGGASEEGGCSGAREGPQREGRGSTGGRKASEP